MSANRNVEQRRKREYEFCEQIRELELICGGLYREILPSEVKECRIETAYIKGISDELAKESVDAESPESTKYFYKYFYQTVLFYLLTMCNIEDQIFGSITKIAETFSRKECLPLSKTVLGILINDIKLESLSKRERLYAEECFDSYEEFRASYAEEMRPEMFFETIDKAVRSYIAKQGYSCFDSEKKYMEVMRIIKDSCYDLHFTVYRRWEID